jgi:hypothetical protein
MAWQIGVVVPQGLKPGSLRPFFGATEVVP